MRKYKSFEMEPKQSPASGSNNYKDTNMRNNA